MRREGGLYQLLPQRNAEKDLAHLLSYRQEAMKGHDWPDGVLPPLLVESCMKKVKEAWAEEPYAKSQWEGDANLPNARRRRRHRSRFTTAMYERYGGLSWLRILFSLGSVDESCVRILNDELRSIIAEKGCHEPVDKQGCRTNAAWQGWEDADGWACVRV